MTTLDLPRDLLDAPRPAGEHRALSAASASTLPASLPTSGADHLDLAVVTIELLVSRDIEAYSARRRAAGGAATGPATGPAPASAPLSTTPHRGRSVVPA